uniref:DNA topoisomerase I n=1 Tax=Romanomermis culicivorax TaxID=13658 RepID=A0A915IA65_ROMCU
MLISNDAHPSTTSAATKNFLKNEPSSDDEDDVPLAERSNHMNNSKNNYGSIKKEIKQEPEYKDLKKSAVNNSFKKEPVDDEEDDIPLAERSKSKKKDKKEDKHMKKRIKYEEESEDEKPKKKKTKVLESVPSPSKVKSEGGRKKKAEEQQEVWKWWEEQNHHEGIKWKYLEHKGPMFAPPYEPLPPNVKFYYDGKPMKLSLATEEVATFYSKMIEHDYVTKDAFNTNFFRDWHKIMTAKEKEIITDLKKCDFREMHAHFVALSEERKARSKEEKQKEKEEKEKIQKEYGVAIIDGHKEKIGNFRIEPPGLFRGRGTHPKMGMLKRRVMPEDVIINCSKDSKIPSPPAGHKWKEVKHDNTVTWLASWSENIMGSIKYVMLNPSSKIKGEKDWQKYETARKLKSKVKQIREQYKEDWKSKEMRIRQRAVALYFIDKLALRAGNEKEEGETADTVGCCSLRCEHIKLHDEIDGQEWVVEFDFLGKDSIRYYNKIPVEKRVFKNLKLFMENKAGGDDLFDRLNTGILNKHLTALMDGLTAKVFRTYNASFTLQQQLDSLTKAEMSPAEKLLSYNRANRQVAILCNHQRSVPKAHGKQMELLQEKIKEVKDKLKVAKGELKDAKKTGSKNLEQKQKQYDRVKDQLQKLEVKATDKVRNMALIILTLRGCVLNQMPIRQSEGYVLASQRIFPLCKCI